MTKSTATIVLIIIVLVTLPLFFITIPVLIYSYNALIRKKNQVEFSYSGVDVMLKKRYDLIPNIVQSVQKIMTHESSLFERITALRSKISDGMDTENRFGLENEMSQLLGQLNVTMENYPDIKSNENMMHLQRTLTETEEQISASRRAYNSSVNSFNNSIESVPSNIMAGFLEYTTKVYFEATEIERTTPQVGQLFK